MRRIILIITAAAMLTACLDADPFLYRCMTMGYVNPNGSFKADDGNTYIFEGIEPTWKAGERLIAIMDVTEAIRDSVYRAKNVSIAYPLYKKPVYIAPGQAVPDTLGLDEITMTNGWYSGGCLNMYNQIKILPDTGPHIVNLLVESRQEVPDTLYLTLKHRSDADIPEFSALSPYSFYSSFPIAEYLPEKDSVVLKLSWFWDGKQAGTTAKVKR